MDDPSGWLWLIINGAGVGIFAAALIYGTILWRNRRKDWGTRQKRDAVTRENYRQEGWLT